ncbi:MAG: ABC transporter permease [Oscillospiraceae bacterium]|nr:ABC transporter permease [Oscillospiraceae bacterium]
MNKVSAFSSRNFKEIIRDPLSYIFCLGFPLVMLLVMTIINDSIPPQTGMTIFRIDNLAGGIAVFGLTFVMLFTCLNVAKDRSGAFLVRLYATPMRSGDFILGYVLPTSLLAVLQILITLAASFIVSLIVDVELNPLGLLLALLSLLPTIVMMIACGLLFGTVFSEKAAPGLCSIVISLASFLGGVWFDADGLGGVMLKICEVLPFYHAVKAARMATALDFGGYLPHLLITLVYSAVVTIAAVIVFKSKMKADLQ